MTFKPFLRNASASSDALPSTPRCNTGYVNTSASGTRSDAASGAEITCTIDYLRVTLPALSEEAEAPAGYVCDLLAPGADWTANRGRWNYQAGWTWGNVSVYAGGNKGTVHADITGQGCRQLESQPVLQDGWQSFFARLLSEGMRFPRIDFAFDVRDGSLDLERIEATVRAGQCVTRLGSFDPRRPIDIRTGQATGYTLYFGSRKNGNYLVRMYDKQLETIARGEADPGPWVRVEIEAHDAAANVLAAAFAKGGPSVIASDLYARLDFKDPGSSADSNRSRWQTADWWRSFLGGARKARVVLSPVVKTVEKAAAYLKKNVSGLLAMMALLPDYGPAFIRDLTHEGQYRLRPHHTDMMHRHLALQQ